MRIISRRALKEFTESLAGHRDHTAVKAAIDGWFAEVSKVTWQSASDVKKLFATASIINAERVVFNIKGNDYRLVVAIDYEKSIIWIKWIGSHRDYDRIDVSKVKYD